MKIKSFCTVHKLLTEPVDSPQHGRNPLPAVLQTGDNRQNAPSQANLKHPGNKTASQEMM